MTITISPDSSLAELAAQFAGASRVFGRRKLDYCCGGRTALALACERAGLDVDEVVAELETEASRGAAPKRWDDSPADELIDHIEQRFHAAHRAELPLLIAMARKVERVHRERKECPRGLAALLEQMRVDLESHMQKEEEVVFPLFRSGETRAAWGAIHLLEKDHDAHGARLTEVRRRTHDLTPPADGCGTWRALYARLEELESDLMEHVHLENYALFPRAVVA